MTENEKPSPYKLKIWFAYTPEEKSYVVLRSYQLGYLTSQDIEPFLSKARWNHASNILFPVFCLPYLSLKYKFANATHTTLARSMGKSAAFCGVLWLLWLNWSPFYRSMERKKEDLLETLDRKLGGYMTALNDVLPRFWTEGEVNRQIRRLYNQRNGMLTGYVYPYEELAEPLYDKTSFAKTKRGKIGK